jgi:hypothetical protein
VLLAAAAGCSGKQSVEGSCARASARVVDGGESEQWLCTTSATGAPRGLASCSVEPVVGGSCAQQETVDTTNANEPAHFTTYPECFGCTSNGTGADWTCESSGWQVAGTFSCPP